MRIIAGRFKGHRLVAFSASHLRPTTDRVKETLFNKLMNVTEGARFLDLFSGTGNLALEALSRGASEVVCVESHRQSLGLIRENVKKLKVTSGLQIESQDVFKFLKSYSGPKFDVILADPPFTKQIAHLVMEAIATSQVLGPETQVVIESSSNERIDDVYLPLTLLDRRAFGDKSMSFFSCPQ